MRIAAESLSLRLGNRLVLDGVAFAAGTGEFVGLVGPNGAGKTTLLRVLAGLLAPTSGRATIDGRPIADVPRDERARRLAVLFQGESVGWPMRVRELVALGRLPHRRAFAGLDAADRAAIDRAMALTEVAHLADRPEPTLSAGERMRVLLARALSVEAQMLLADEPITALDPAHQLDAMALLRSVAHRGTGQGAGVVAVLHDLTLAARFCDRVVVMSGGRIAADAAPGAALGDGLLRRVFGITAQRGSHADGTGYILPWGRVTARPGPDRGERRP